MHVKFEVGSFNHCGAIRTGLIGTVHTTDRYQTKTVSRLTGGDKYTLNVTTIKNIFMFHTQ